MDQQTGYFTQFHNDPDDPGSISHSTVNTIAEDLDGNLVVGTLGGLNRYDRKYNTFYHFPVNQNDDYSLNNEFINTIFCDKQGNLWVGTDKGGINKFNTHQKQFGYFVSNATNINSLNYNTINSVFDETSTLWIGTAGGGLNTYDKSSRKFNHYRNNPHNPASIHSNFITSFCRDNNQNLWIGTWGGGLDKVISLKGEGRFIHHIKDNLPTSLCNVFISSLWVDEKGFMVVGTFGGLDLLYSEKGIFKHVLSNANDLHKITEAGCILKDKKGFYWIGTPASRRFVTYTNLKGGDYTFRIKASNSDGIWNNKPTELQMGNTLV